MQINNLEDLDKARVLCKKLVTRRALAAGAASAVPGAVVGVAADVTILMNLLPKINKVFGLNPDQVDELDEQVKEQVLMVVSKIGSNFAAKTITKEAIAAAAKAVGIRASIKAASSWLPFIGPAIGGTIGFGMMKYLGNQHVDECYAIVGEVLRAKKNPVVSEVSG